MTSLIMPNQINNTDSAEQELKHCKNFRKKNENETNAAGSNATVHWLEFNGAFNTNWLILCLHGHSLSYKMTSSINIYISASGVI